VLTNWPLASLVYFTAYRYVDMETCMIDKLVFLVVLLCYNILKLASIIRVHESFGKSFVDVVEM